MRRDPSPDGEGFATPPFLAMGDGQSVMWNRSLSKDMAGAGVAPSDRQHAVYSLRQALGRVGAKRLVVGHTPQVRARRGLCLQCGWCFAVCWVESVVAASAFGVAV